MVQEDKIKDILRQADLFAGRCGAVAPSVIADGVRSRLRLRHRRSLYLRFAASAAAVLIVCIGIWNIPGHSAGQDDLQVKQANIEQLQAEVRRLAGEVDSVLVAVRKVIDEEKSNATLVKLEAELAGISDPLEEVQRQVDRAAFIIVYQADRMYREHNLTDSAIESYNRAIEFFPSSKWAGVAQERLLEIESNKKTKRKSNTFKENFNADYKMFSCINVDGISNLPSPRS